MAQNKLSKLHDNVTDMLYNNTLAAGVFLLTCIGGAGYGGYKLAQSQVNESTATEIKLAEEWATNHQGMAFYVPCADCDAEELPIAEVKENLISDNAQLPLGAGAATGVVGGILGFTLVLAGAQDLRKRRERDAQPHVA